MAAIQPSDRELVTRVRLLTSRHNTTWILPGILTLIILAAGAVEWIYSPIEQALGAYMYSTRDLRGQVGQGWELNRESTEALDALGEIADKTRRRRTAGSTLDSWDQIPAVLDSFQVFSVSPERFLTLYGQLPSAFQASIVDPIDLLRTRSSGNWRRVFFVHEGGEYLVYLISADNLVLHQSSLPDDFFEHYSDLSQPVPAKLEDLPEFPLIMDAESFFHSLAPEGEIELDGDDIRWISNLDGELTRIGLAQKPDHDLWKVAFETRQGDQTTIRYYWFTETIGRELVKDLRWFIPRGGLGL